MTRYYDTWNAPLTPDPTVPRRIFLAVIGLAFVLLLNAALTTASEPGEGRDPSPARIDRAELRP